MHYKNGREAKAGDVVVNLQTGKTGVLYETVAGVKQCSARIAPIGPNDDYVAVGECLHLGDVAAATVPDSSLAVPEPLTGLNTAGAALVLLLVMLFGFSAEAQTNLISTNSTFTQIEQSIEASGILQATNYSVDPYVTYAPNAPDKVGGGVLAIYNVNNYAGLALGVDWLGHFSMVSANLTLKLPIAVGTYLPSSWTWAANLELTPFVLVGTGAPLGGSSSSGVTTIEDAGAAIEFGHLWGGRFNAGASYGQWQNAGAYSGVRYHGFFGWSHGF